MLLLLGTEVARLEYPSHYRAKASHLGGPLSVFLVWSGLSALDGAMDEGDISAM